MWFNDEQDGWNAEKQLKYIFNTFTGSHRNTIILIIKSRYQTDGYKTFSWSKPEGISWSCSENEPFVYRAPVFIYLFLLLCSLLITPACFLSQVPWCGIRSLSMQWATGYRRQPSMYLAVCYAAQDASVCFELQLWWTTMCWRGTQPLQPEHLNMYNTIKVGQDRKECLPVFTPSRLFLHHFYLHFICTTVFNVHVHFRGRSLALHSSIAAGLACWIQCGIRCLHQFTTRVQRVLQPKKEMGTIYTG